MTQLLTRLWIHLAASLHRLPFNDRGSASDNVIWIAFLAGIGLTVTGIFGPRILAAAQSVVFK
ncbi:hypothetical protein [Streptomyces sp. NPDC059009]|uniref:hypothetical protein n=1 Tax=Streptomyces sp. NPDC059009 TaxID=3346694 RepID=UPI0036B83B77